MERAQYQSFFCGLSGCLSREYSPVARFLVNRDSAFLSLLLSGVSQEEPSAVMTTCCNPIAVRRPLYQDGAAVEYAAAVTMCGLQAKLSDDEEDERGFRKLLAKTSGALIEGASGRAVAFLNTVGFPTAEVSAVLSKQGVAEKTGSDLMGSANATAHAYGEIFGFGGRKFGDPSIDFKRLGEAVGRLIYWRDAWDDYEQDLARNRFNPLRHHSRHEMSEVAGQEAVVFRDELRKVGLRRHESLLERVLSTTFWKHSDLIPMSQVNTAEEKEKREKRKRQVKSKDEGFCSRCCSGCDCPTCGCNSGRSSTQGCCDSCFDCGPGDSGCCDCGCG